VDQRQDAPAVSVALGTYNGEDFVAEQVRSILEQSRPAAELVVSDDGSTDRTLEIIDATIAEYRAAHPERMPVVRVLTHAKLGIAGNFEAAFRACSHELIAPADQDDVWEPERLERMVAAMQAAPGALLLHADARLIDGRGRYHGVDLFTALGVSERELSELASGRSFDTFMRRNLATGMTMMFRAPLRDAAFPIPEGWIHDEWLAIVAAATGGTVLLHERLSRYRQHGRQAIGARRPGPIILLKKLLEPQQPRNGRLLTRARSLDARFATLEGVTEEQRRIVREKLAHEEHRSSLPFWSWSRIRRVRAVARAGGYDRFGNGAKDVLRDIAQPGSRRRA
jgi:glycosyltransferase involved in cell wall biosynthesis